MFPSLGEQASFNEENSLYGSDDDPYTAEAYDTNQDDEPPRPVKMFWHAHHIDKVQELVPEEVRSVLLSYQSFNIV